MLQNEIANDQHQADELQCGFKLLHGQYQIVSALNSGGFGITYLARDSLDRRVVIKECFPVGVCYRVDGQVEPVSQAYEMQYKSVLRNFLREAQWLARSVLPGVVSVHQVFRENNTAYIAMDFVDGLDLVSIREEQPERLNNDSLRNFLEQALDTLAFIHDLGILHRDISPDNFVVSGDGKLTLIDFGAACGRRQDEDGALDAMQSVKDGFSAHELYLPDMPHRPSSDLYSLGATFYYLVTGTPPPNSQQRLDALASGDPDPCRFLANDKSDADQELMASIDKALSVLPGVRFQSAEEWLEVLNVGTCEPEISENTPALTSAPKVTELDSDFEEMVASLVEHTNSGLKPKSPGSDQRAKAAKPEPSPDHDCTPRQLVDIFGEPVSDVETWLVEQDKSSRAKRPVVPQDPEPDCAELPNTQNGTARLSIGKLIPLRLRQMFGGAASQSNELPTAQKYEDRP